MAATLEIPEEVLGVLGGDPTSAAEELRLLAAMKLFELGRLSSGAAASLAGLARVEFLAKLGEYRGSPFQISPAELEQDLENARSPALTEEEDEGLRQALASLRAGKGRPAEHVRQRIDALLRK